MNKEFINKEDIIVMSISCLFVALIIACLIYIYFNSRDEYNKAMDVKRALITSCEKYKDQPIGLMTPDCYRMFMSGNI